MKLQVNTKHVKLRIVLFVIFFLIAVAAFTYGFVNLGKKSSGYQKIEASTDAEALLYNNDVTFRYYFDGSSNEIKREVKELTALYTSLYGPLYKALDSANVYESVVSLAYINSHLGEVISVSPELYNILKDAYSKTLENSGFNLFSGALFEEWRSILVLQDPQDFDVLVNEDQAQRLSAIASVVSDLSNFSLEFLSDSTCSVRLSVSDSYAAFASEYELSSCILDLGNLKQAYLLETLASSLVSSGYSIGYLCTEDGTALCMSALGSLDYDMYTMTGSELVKYASVPLEGRFSAFSMNAFGMGSPYSYSITSGSDTLYRSLYFDVASGAQSSLLMSLNLISGDNNLVDLSYKGLQLCSISSAMELERAAAALPSDILCSYTLQLN